MFHHVFPQTIGEDKNPNYLRHMIDLITHIQQTNERFLYNPHTHPVMGDLMVWIDQCVNKYTQHLNFPDEYTCSESWIHDYEMNTYQPWHTHAGNIISAVYIIQANAELDTKLYFKSPVTDMMNPFNSNMNPYNKGYDVNEYNNEQVAYPSTPGVLYTFRSHLEHSITQKVTDTKRVILALNYNRS